MTFYLLGGMHFVADEYIKIFSGCIIVDVVLAFLEGTLAISLHVGG